MNTTDRKRTLISQEEVEQLFSELDRRHFGGYFVAAGYAVKLTALRENDYAQCHVRRKLILIDPRRVDGGYDLRGVLLHEMTHATCGREDQYGSSHGARWRRELTRLYLAGEWSIARELFIMQKVLEGVLPVPPPEHLQYMLDLHEKRSRKDNEG